MKKLIFLFAIILFFAPSAHATTYATWNPSDKDADLTLSGGNLIVSKSTDAVWRSGRSDTSKSSGKWYWEITVNHSGTNGVQPGIAKSTDSISVDFGQGANAYIYNSSGDVYNNSIIGGSYSSFGLNDVIGIALDLDTGKIFFSKNGVWQNSGDPTAGTGYIYAGLSGTYFAGISLYHDGAGVTANFGATAFTYGPPSGYNAGLYGDIVNNTVDRLAKFITQTTVGDSLFSDDGSSMTLTAGNLFMQIGSLIDTIAAGALNFGTTNATSINIGRPAMTTTVPGTISFGKAATTANCNSAASPAVCGSAPSGSVAMATGGSALVVNTTAVTADSQILVTEDSSLGTRLGITCNTNTNRNYSISARTPGTSFTIKSNINPNTNKACLSYWIIN